jgi:hypothetical protein
MKLSVYNLKKPTHISEFLSKKYPISKKKSSKTESGSGDIVDSKSAFFRVFFW